MSQIFEPRFAITVLLIALFGYAYIQDPADQAMKGAIIAAFSAAYGFWIGSKGNDEATKNTGKAFAAIEAAAKAGPLAEPEVAGKAAQQVADEAQDAADEIKGDANAGLPDELK